MTRDGRDRFHTALSPERRAELEAEVSLTGALLALIWAVICGSALVGWALIRLGVVMAWSVACVAVAAFVRIALFGLYAG